MVKTKGIGNITFYGAICGNLKPKLLKCDYKVLMTFSTNSLYTFALKICFRGVMCFKTCESNLYVVFYQVDFSCLWNLVLLKNLYSSSNHTIRMQFRFQQVVSEC